MFLFLSNRVRRFSAVFPRRCRKLSVIQESAVEILSELTDLTDAVRINLELGRALYLSDKLHDARDKFVEVLDKLPADAPPQVRANVEQFLIDINRKLNPLRFSFSVVRDSNPTLSTDTRRVTIFGLDFDYTPQIEAKKEYGLRLTGDFLLKTSEKIEFAGFLSHTQYETSGHTRSLVVPEIRYLLAENRNFWARIGFEYEGLNKETLRQSPFIGFRKFTDFPEKRASTILDVRYVSQSYPKFPFVSGQTIEAQIFGNYQIKPSMVVDGRLGFESTSAREDSYSSRSTSFGYGLSFYNLSFWYRP